MRIGLVRSGIFDPPSHYNGHFFAKIQLLQKIIFVPRIVPAKTLPFTLQRTLLLKKLAPVFKFFQERDALLTLRRTRKAQIRGMR